MADETNETQVTPSDLTVVTNIVDADKIMVHHSNGTTEVIQGSALKTFINTVVNANTLSALDTSKTNPVNSSAVNSALANYKKPSVNKCYTATSGATVLSGAIFSIYGSYDTSNYHYFKYLVVDTDGNTLTEYVKYKYNTTPVFSAGVSNGITRTNQNTYGTLVFSSISTITFWEITQADFEETTRLTSTLANCKLSVSGSTLTITNGSYYWTLNGTALTSIASATE